MNAEDNNNPTPTDPEHGISNNDDGPASVVDKHDLIWRTKELFEYISKRAAAGRLTTASRRGKVTLGREFFEEELENIDKECHGIYLNKTADEAAKDWNGNMKHRHAASWAAAMRGTFSIGAHEENATSDHRVAMRELTKRRAAAATEKMEIEAKSAVIKSQLSIENAKLAVLLKKQKLAVVYSKQTRKKGPLHADVHDYFSTGRGQKSMLLASFNEEDQADIDGAIVAVENEQGEKLNAELNNNRAAAVELDNENPAGNVVLNNGVDNGGQQQKSPLTAPPLPRAVAATSKAGEKEKESEEEDDDDDEDEAASYEQDDQHIMRERTRKLFCFISQKVAAGAVAVASVDSPHNSPGLPTAFFEMHMPDIIKECDGFYFGCTAGSARKDWNSCKKRCHAVSWAAAMAGQFHQDQEVRRQDELSNYHHRMKELSMQRAVAKTRKTMLDSENAKLGLLLKKQRLAKGHGTYHKDVIKYLASTATTSKRLNDCDDGDEDGNNVTLARLFRVNAKVVAKDKLKQTKLQKFLRPHNIAEKYSSGLGKKKMPDVRAEECLEEISDNDDSHVRDETSRHLPKPSLPSASAVFRRSFVDGGNENSEESGIFKRGFLGEGDENSEVIFID